MPAPDAAPGRCHGHPGRKQGRGHVHAPISTGDAAAVSSTPGASVVATAAVGPSAPSCTSPKSCIGAGPEPHAAAAARHLSPRGAGPVQAPLHACIRAKSPRGRAAPSSGGRGVRYDRAGPPRPRRRISSRSSWSRFASIADSFNTSIMCLSAALRPLAVRR